MKKYILALLMVANIGFAQEVHWITDDGFKSKNDCIVEVQSHSQTTPISEYWLICDTPIEDKILIPPGLFSSHVSIKLTGSTTSELSLMCPMEISIFGTGNGFYMLLDCRVNELIFKNSFE